MSNKPRKTYPVETLKDKINADIRNADSEEARLTLCALIESVLFDTNNYKGFAYIDEKGHYTDPVRWNAKWNEYRRRYF